MAYPRNLLGAGDCVVMVPVGLQITIQYNQKGQIERIYQGFSTEGEDLTREMLTSFLKNRVVPNVISLKNTVTFVRGVLYTDTLFCDRGKLPECMFPNLRKHFEKFPQRFKFYAGCVNTVPSTFSGLAAIRQWFTFAGFEMLPCFIVPMNMTDEQYNLLLRQNSEKFKTKLVTDYIVINQSEISFRSTGLRQFVIKRVEQTVDDLGYIRETLISAYGKERVTLDISETVKYNLQPGVLVVLDEKNLVEFHHYDPNSGEKVKTRSRSINCGTCGRVIDLPFSGMVRCTDPNCNSRLFPDVQHLLTTLSLPSISRKEYDEITKKAGSGFSPVDVLDYLNLEESITTSVPEALFAATPLDVVSNVNFFSRLFEACNSSVDSLMYYLQNPDSMLEDLKLQSAYTERFANWLSVGSNYMSLVSILTHEKIQFQSKSKKFAGAPIFRGKSIILTGRFRHGSLSEVKSILEGYSARVTTQFDADAGCLLIGSLNEETNGKLVRTCAEKGMSVFYEDDFFKTYEIDQDLAENL